MARKSRKDIKKDSERYKRIHHSRYTMHSSSKQNIDDTENEYLEKQYSIKEFNKSKKASKNPKELSSPDADNLFASSNVSENDSNSQDKPAKNQSRSMSKLLANRNKYISEYDQQEEKELTRKEKKEIQRLKKEAYRRIAKKEREKKKQKKEYARKQREVKEEIIRSTQDFDYEEGTLLPYGVKWNRLNYPRTYPLIKNKFLPKPIVLDPVTREPMENQDRWYPKEYPRVYRDNEKTNINLYSLPLEMSYHDEDYKLRLDIKDYCQNRFEANIIRILLVHHAFYRRAYLDLYYMNVIVDKEGILFNRKGAFVMVVPEYTPEIAANIERFRSKKRKNNCRLYVIAHEDSGYERMPYEMDRSYEWFEQRYLPKIALWETESKNVDTMPDLYYRHWLIGKSELQRKHKKYFYPNNNGIRIKIGKYWKKQPFKGRPRYQGMYLDTFKVYDSDTNKVRFMTDDWAKTVQDVRKLMKDNAYEFYQRNKYAIVSGRIKKTGQWVDIINYDAVSNSYISVDKFLRE